MSNGECNAEKRVRRILFLRRHKWPFRLVGAVLGAAAPALIFPLLVFLSDRLLQSTAYHSMGLPSLFFLFAPMFLVLIIPGAALGFFIARNATARRVPYGYCQFCGYNLQHYTVPRCPECGKSTASEY